MISPRSIEDLGDVYGLRFLVRASLDVPIHDGVVQNEFRVRRAIPTIEYLIQKGARVIILTHVGRDPKNTTKPLVTSLEKHIPVRYVPGVVGDEVYAAVAHMKEGSAILLENVRSHGGEEANDPTFAETLASYADFYVNDAFAVSHRSHASIVGLPKYLPSFGGITFMEEYRELKKVLTPEHPSLFILGGAKFETKAPLIEKYAHEYTHTFIGGALANDFLKGKGYEVGTSLLSPTDLSQSPLIHRENIVLPVDVIAKDAEDRLTDVAHVLPTEKILDIGPATLEMLAPYIQGARTILWNGPVGYYETHDTGTKELAKLIAESSAFSVVGGGDTVAAIESLGLDDKFGFLSTAGGAMLHYLEAGTLPGITALSKF